MPGPVSDEFVAACVEAQVAHLRGKGGRNQAHVNKFLRTRECAGQLRPGHCVLGADAAC